MRFIRLLLLPLSVVYGLGVMTRNLLFDLGMRRQQEFKLPVISVGNLTVGGSGKSPVTEYIIAILKDALRVAALSRGYGRKTKGFRIVESESQSLETGDEPLQFKRKFPDVTVAVCEDRVEGIRKLQNQHDVIVLDDAYQHRSVKPGLSILLFDYTNIYQFKALLPAGDLREPFWEKDRADILLVTKAPADINQAERKRLIELLNPHDEQSVFFSYLSYGELLPYNSAAELRPMLSVKVHSTIILLTGIANPAPLLYELGGYTQNILHHKYPDHYRFRKGDLKKLMAAYRSLTGDKLIITTEKDIQRLSAPELQPFLENLPIYYLPVKAELNEPGKSKFNELIISYATGSRADG